MMKFYKSKSKLGLLSVAMFLFAAFSSLNNLNAQCTLVCNDLIQISMDEDCSVPVQPDMVLEGSTPNTCPNGALVVEMKISGTWVPAVVTSSHLNQTIQVRVRDTNSGQSCWGNMFIEDKLAPEMDCTDITINCAVSNYTPTALAALGIAGANPTVTENCGTFTTSFDDTFFDLACGATAGGVDASAYIRRVWTAVDNSGNLATCTQFIYFQRLHVTDVLYPADITVNCTAANSDPSNTGAPHVLVNGNAVNLYPNNTLCELNVAYNDQILPVCDGSYKILRTWVVYDWCLPTSSFPPNQNPFYHIQLIKVLDSTGPSFVCPADMTVGIDAFDCNKDLNLPDFIVTDDCSRLSSIEAKWKVDDIWFNEIGAFSSFVGNNLWNPDTMAVVGTAENLPLGTTRVLYTLSDDCGNASACQFSVLVEDDVPPVAICTEYTQVSLGADGTVVVPASAFNQGSYDNCGTVDFKVRRMFPNDCQDINRFWDEAVFCCDDIGQTITIVLRVYDVDMPDGDVSISAQEEHSNECMIQVLVDDKLRPVCTAPENVTISCEAFDPTLWYGTPTAVDNCCLDTITTSNDYSRFDTVCNKGTITRTFRAFDCAGLSATCSQRIFVNYTQDYQIRFPNDVIVTVCDGSGNYGEPQINKKDCELMAVNYEDQVFTVVPDACFKIERTWTILNWCTYDPNGACITVPNPSPNPIVNHPTNLPGPVVSPLGTPNPWAPTVVRVNATDPAATNYSLFWDASANCYKYKQIIKIIDGQAPQHNGCMVDGCDLTPNDNLFWNTMDWWDGTTQSHDLCEAPVDLSLTGTDLCSGANVNIHALLFLDTDQDGIMETVINTNALQTYPAGGVLYNNYANASYGGGDFRAFDHRPVPPNQINRFWFKQVVSGTNRTAKLGWATVSESQNAGLNGVTNAWQPANAQLPYGTHKIKWFIEDGCGNQTTCENIFTVKDCKKPTVVCINGLSTNIMQTGMATVWTSDFVLYGEDNCTPASRLVYSMRKSGTGTGFPLDPITGLPVTNLTWNCSELGTQYVEIWAKDLAGNADYCETYIIIQDNMGNCGPNATVAGFLKTEAQSGLEEANVAIMQGMNMGGSTITDQTGAYSFQATNALPIPSTAYILPAKNNDPLNGVSTYDLLLISKHILGVQPLNSPYKMIAADVNKSGSITTFDIIELRKLVLGIYTELPNNDSWRFVGKAHQFSNSANPFVAPFPESTDIATAQSNMLDVSFVAVKVGDVNGNAVANNLMSSDDRTAGTLLFDVNDRNVVAGEEFTLDFKAAEQVLGYQFTMNYEGLEVLDIVPGAGLKSDNFAVFATENALTSSFDGEQAGAFAVKFRAAKSGKLSQMLSLSSRITRTEAYSKDASRQEVALRFNTENGATIAGVGFELYQNMPNPFVNKTVIGFHLLEATEATLTVFDETGRTLFTKKGDFAKGENAVIIDRSALNFSGLMYYQLETPDFSASKKMIQN